MPEEKQEEKRRIDFGHKPVRKQKGYQPQTQNLDPKNPPTGGSGLSSGSSKDTENHQKRD